MVQPFTLLTDYDIALFQSGKHFRLYEKMGSHIVEHEGLKGVCFAVWAPNAKSVAVTGNFNQWNTESHPLQPRWDSSGSRVPLASRDWLMTHANGAMPARPRSCWRRPASCTGVASARVTMSTWV